MARPTDEKKEKTVKLRISEDLYNKLVSKGANLSETIRKILSESFVPQKTAKISEKNGASPNKYEIDEKILDDLATMQMFMGGSVAEMIRLFDEAVNEGVIAYENGRYVGVPDVDLETFYEVCHERGVEPQEAINKLVLDMRKGK